MLIWKLSLQQSREVWKRLLSEDKQTALSGGSLSAQPPVGELRFLQAPGACRLGGNPALQEICSPLPSGGFDKNGFLFQGIL